MHEADGGVPGAEGEQFPIGADLLAAPGERAGGEHVVAEGHDEHAEGRQRQLAQPGRLQARESGGGQAGRDRPGYLDAVPLQPEPGDGDGGQQHGEQRPWSMGPPGLQQDQERQDRHAAPPRPCPALGGQARVRVPPGTQPGDVLTVRGKGLPRFRGHGRGNLNVTVIVDIPGSSARGSAGLCEQLRAEGAEATAEGEPARVTGRDPRAWPEVTIDLRIELEGRDE